MTEKLLTSPSRTPSSPTPPPLSNFRTAYRSNGNGGIIIHRFMRATAPTPPFNYSDVVGLDFPLKQSEDLFMLHIEMPHMCTRYVLIILQGLEYWKLFFQMFLKK